MDCEKYFTRQNLCIHAAVDFSIIILHEKIMPGKNSLLQKLLHINDIEWDVVFPAHISEAAAFEESPALVKVKTWLVK